MSTFRAMTWWALPCLVVLPLTALTARRAAAARPLATDAAGVLARGDCDAELHGTRLNLPGSSSETAASAQLGCGLGADTQAAIGYGRSSQPDADNGSRKEAVVATAKLRLFETAGGHAFSLAAGSVVGRTGSGPFQFDSVNVYGIWSGALAENVTGHGISAGHEAAAVRPTARPGISRWSTG